jgi:hypothetical protein
MLSGAKHRQLRTGSKGLKCFATLSNDMLRPFFSELLMQCPYLLCGSCLPVCLTGAGSWQPGSTGSEDAGQ